MVFGIGLSKTGTTSLNRALRILGYASCHQPWPNAMLRGKYYEALWGFDAATDASVAVFFRELDAAFPGSKFILTVREPQAWLTSWQAHVNHPSRLNDAYLKKGEAADLRRKIYGTTEFEAETLLKAVINHRELVLNYFADRPNDLLIMDIFSGDSWPELCRFLGKDIPKIEFPYLNPHWAPVIEPEMRPKVGV